MHTKRIEDEPGEFFSGQQSEVCHPMMVRAEDGDVLSFRYPSEVSREDVVDIDRDVPTADHARRHAVPLRQRTRRLLAPSAPVVGVPLALHLGLMGFPRALLGAVAPPVEVVGLIDGVLGAAQIALLRAERHVRQQFGTFADERRTLEDEATPRAEVFDLAPHPRGHALDLAATGSAREDSERLPPKILGMCSSVIVEAFPSAVLRTVTRERDREHLTTVFAVSFKRAFHMANYSGMGA